MSAENASRRVAARNLAPFFGASLFAWVTVIMGSSIDWPEYALATALAALAGVWRLLPLHGAIARAREVPPSLIFLCAVALLRDSAGGVNSGMAILALLPVFYTALSTSDRRQLAIVTAGVAVFFLAPILIVGGPTFPPSQYRAGALFVAISAIIGLATQQLVADARFQAAEAKHRESMLEQIGTVLRGLSSSSHARVEVCEAAKTISNASIAILYEPSNAEGALHSTAMAGIEAPPIEIGSDERSGVREAFRTRRSLFFTVGCESEIFNMRVWEASGRPECILFEPLLRDGNSVGVLVVGWPHVVKPGGSRASVVGLLAHEVATVIERADRLARMTDMASTDTLTGLPNRRVWDRGVAQALADDQPVAVAILDFDHFKEYNDSRGHPAGDRLLKETAAAWREELRSSDILARIGGEEFALLLPNCNATYAETVVERLRARVSGDQTCSAGIAIRAPGESAEALMARADTALYQAKTAGRDRAWIGQLAP
jgi:diguanylate cyclase (GGDEF)-like protein